MKKVIYAIAAAAFVSSAVAAPPPKVTGSDNWDNGAGVNQYAEFVAIGMHNGKDPKGMHYQENQFGSLTVDVDNIWFYANHACYTGINVEATGNFYTLKGRRAFIVVQDGGNGQNETGNDRLRGGFGFAANTIAPPAYCVNGDFANNETFYNGNVQMHYQLVSQ